MSTETKGKVMSVNIEYYYIYEVLQVTYFAALWSANVTVFVDSW